MLRIRKIYDDTTEVDQSAFTQVEEILRVQFPGLSPEDIEKVRADLRNPLTHKFRTILFVAEGGRAQVRGFAILLHAPDLQFSYLDFISAVPGGTGGGIGGALYERVREEAGMLNTVGLFFESLPDDPKLSPDPVVRKQNASRLRFYEQFGARPIANTEYETPVKPGDDNPPYLVFDDLGRGIPLAVTTAKSIVRAILERKYGKLCPPAYVKRVVDSFRDDPVLLRPPRFVRKSDTPVLSVPVKTRKIALIINDKHSIHHVRERGYVESPVRIDSITKQILPTGLFEVIPSRSYSEDPIRAVHDPSYVEFFKNACKHVPLGKSIYPYVFPLRNPNRPPKELPLRAGYYCIDTFTPLHRNAYPAARGAVNCALTAAHLMVEGYRLAYALVRPPGHHAEKRAYGGFCYFNASAVAAHYLSRFGPVAVLDIDYHHGNGTQDIFYERKDVFTISLHGHPRHTYPYFSGFEDERGAGDGKDYNRNYALPEGLAGPQYQEVLARALRRIRRFQPRFLIVALGLDTARGDPTGSFQLLARDFERNGAMIGALGLPTAVIQEGGYKNRSLGINARNFFSGLWQSTANTTENRNNHRPGAVTKNH